MKQEQQKKAISRVFRRIIKKHRIKIFGGHEYAWWLYGDRMTLGNGVMINKNSNRDKRRFKGALPEIISCIRRTKIACGLKEPVIFADEVINVVGIDHVEIR